MQSTDLRGNQPQLFPRMLTPLSEKQNDHGLTTKGEAVLSIASPLKFDPPLRQSDR